MKVIFDYCHQIRRYGPSAGLCLVLLEDDETKQDIEKVFKVGQSREWYEQRYYSAKLCSFEELSQQIKDNYSQEINNLNIDLKGKTVMLMETYQSI